ncbi:TIM barrel protein [Treponema sp. HNW]|uniref:sugar phosphate isomerase/epimerase family protein n=1 Tax=Treponema sp. HNW TaxID=3116654 RepID=UPI003D1323E0
MLKTLKERGCQYIEVRHWKQDPDCSLIASVFDKILDTGLKISFHGDVNENTGTAGMYASFPWLYSYMEKTSQAPLVLTLHPLNSTQNTVEENYNLTFQMLKHCAEDIEKENLPITVAYEIQRSKGYSDPAVVYSMLVQMVKDLNNPLIKICWDMGHAYANYMQGLIPKEPPSDFLSYTAHTHIHDIRPGSTSTHWPLIFNTVEVETYVNLLRKAGYEGIFNLELSPGKFAHMSVLDGFIKSIDFLRNL